MKTEIISKIDNLAKQDVVLPLSREFNDLTDQFYAIIREEERDWEIKKLELIEAGEKPESIQKPVDPEFDNFKAVVALF